MAKQSEPAVESFSPQSYRVYQQYDISETIDFLKAYKKNSYDNPIITLNNLNIRSLINQNRYTEEIKVFY